MKRPVCLLFLIAMLCCCVTGFAQSNKGTEFWTAYMAHINGSTSQMSLYITSDVDATFRVEFANGTLIAEGTVNANTVYLPPVNIPFSAYLGNTEALPDPANKKGIHITASKPVTVYAHIYDNSVSGATLLLPVSSLNKDYYSINFTQLSNSANSFSTFAVIATEDASTIRITPSADIINRAGNTNTVTHVKNVPYELTLNKGDVYQGTSVTDLTGTHIESISAGTNACKKIAVFSGSSKVLIGAPGSTSDNLFQQVYPTSVWGKNFVTAPLSGRSYDVFRVIYSDKTAVVKVNGVTVDAAQIQTAGSIAYYEFFTPNTAGANNIITSDKPIQVAQYAVTQGNGAGGTRFNEAVGDPEMIYLPPVEQGLKKVTLYSSTYFNILAHYINVVIPTVATSSFILDGSVYGSNKFAAIAGTDYSYAQLAVGAGSHTISASENFNVIAYGFGRAESYGYAAGTNLRNLNEFINFSNLSSTSTQLGGCTGLPYYLQLTIPYEPKQIIWDPVDGTPTVTQNNPASAKTENLADGTKLYTYRFPRTVSYAAGNYTATARVQVPFITSNDCGTERTIEFNFNITDFPVAKFTPPASTCAGSNIQFTDSSDPSGSSIAKWKWNFGDAANSTADNPNTSALPNPQHIFKTGGNYTVTLTVFNENDCESVTTSSHVLHIYTNPVANFKVSTPGCSGQQVTFTDMSVANEGTITEWKWDFDDGNTPQVLTNGTPFTHLFTAARTYNVKLTITNSVGCTSTKSISIEVHPAPVVSFTLPDACIKDVARFTSTSTIADGTETGFTYEWDFGDTFATAANNKAYTKVADHRYTQPGNYNIKLRVKSVYGCYDEKVIPFFLNGAFPVADAVMPSAICSSEDLVVEDRTTVLPGVITRYIIYYDYDNNPTQAEIYGKDNLPIPADRIFKHNYGKFSTPLSKSYHVKMIVYSGSSADCSGVFDKTITVNANPIVTLTHAVDVCQESAAVQFGEDRHGFTGTTLFTGAGVSASGLFNPKTAGPGAHQIKYTFTADGTGCTYSETFTVTVYPTPIITGKRDAIINAGGEVTLQPLVVSLNGSALTYKWTPASGLSSDALPSPVARPASDMQYLLTVTSANGCEAKAIFNVSVLQAPVTYNTFTPNGDGTNDTWLIKNMEYFPKGTVEIFTRNGQKIYYSLGYPVAWDGRYNGRDMPAGVYYYLIDLKNGKTPLSGSVTIIR